MAATREQELDTLLPSFDQIYEDFKSGMAEIQMLKSKCNAEMKKSEALESTCNSLKLENERLKKQYPDSLSKLADQLECRTKCQSLKEELKRASDKQLSEEDEHRRAIELIKEDFATKVGELEGQIRGFLLEKGTNEATISHLRQDLSAHKSHIQTLANRLEQVRFDVESKYTLEIQDLRDCLLVEQEEKKELTEKIKDLEKELLMSRAKLDEQKRDLTLNRNVETLKAKIMKLRKENEILKRKLSHSEEG